MNCIVCEISTGLFAFVGKKGDIEAAFCEDHLSDCMRTDDCTREITGGARQKNVCIVQFSHI